MSNRVFVPASLPIKAADPLTWPRITITGELLDVPGIGAVRSLHDVHLIGWRLLNDCEEPFDCFGMFCDRGLCWRIGQEDRTIWNAFWMGYLPPCVHGVEMAVAVRTPSGAIGKFVARGGAAALQEILRPFFGDDDVADCRSMLFVGNRAIIFKHDEPSPSTRVHWLRRNRVLPDGWETYRESRPAPASGLDAMLRRVYPDPLVLDGNDDPWEPEPCENGWP